MSAALLTKTKMRALAAFVGHLQRDIFRRVAYCHAAAAAVLGKSVTYILFSKQPARACQASFNPRYESTKRRREKCPCVINSISIGLPHTARTISETGLPCR
jgi:hypothetical protein